MSETHDPSGVIIVDKLAGLTSFQVVARVRRVFGRKTKVGHAGTLDPMATGVLIVGVGKATRMLGHLALNDKTYLATIRLGQSTHTDDAEGEITSQCDATDLSEDQIQMAVAGLRGEIMQVPSAVSAIKVDGKRAYARVRNGEHVALKARPVTVDEFSIQTIRRLGALLDLDVHVTCSSGTYVRALARDLGETLGVGGHLTMLRRTRIGRYGIDQAINLDDITADSLIPMTQIAALSFPVIEITAQQRIDASYGRRLDIAIEHNPTAMVDTCGQLIGLYEPDGRRARPIAVLI